MATYPFLSNDWIQAAEGLRDEYKDRFPEPPASVKLNVVVTDLPADVDHPDLEEIDGKPVVKGHVDTNNGQLLMERGHLDEPEITITTDYPTALAAFVTQDQQELMAAFMGGKILVDGDASQLLALQAPPVEPDDAAITQEIFAKVQAFTKTQS